jgi:hypothetical protein
MPFSVERTRVSIPIAHSQNFKDFIAPNEVISGVINTNSGRKATSNTTRETIIRER